MSDDNKRQNWHGRITQGGVPTAPVPADPRPTPQVAQGLAAFERPRRPTRPAPRGASPDEPGGNGRWLTEPHPAESHQADPHQAAPPAPPQPEVTNRGVPGTPGIGPNGAGAPPQAPTPPPFAGTTPEEAAAYHQQFGVWPNPPYASPEGRAVAEAQRRQAPPFWRPDRPRAPRRGRPRNVIRQRPEAAAAARPPGNPPSSSPAGAPQSVAEQPWPTRPPSAAVPPPPPQLEPSPPEIMRSVVEEAIDRATRPLREEMEILRRGLEQIHAGSTATAPAPDGPRRCSFCERPQDQVARLVAGMNAFICDQCVSLSASILSNEGMTAPGAQPPNGRAGPSAPAPPPDPFVASTLPEPGVDPLAAPTLPEPAPQAGAAQ